MEPNTRFKSALMMAGLSQRDFAESINRHENFICGLITGRINPTDKEKKLIARKLKVEEKEIF